MLLFMSCRKEISFTCEAPLNQNDFKLFFLGLSSDIMEIPANSKICGKSLSNIEDKVPNFLLVYKKRLVYYGYMPMDNINDHFNLCFSIHPTQFATTAILEIEYKNSDSSQLNYHEYVIVKMEDSGENLPPDGSWANTAWEQLKESWR